MRSLGVTVYGLATFIVGGDEQNILRFSVDKFLMDNEKDRRAGFFHGAPGRITLLVATAVILLFFAWTYIR